jgi:hypothetical protein
MAETHLWFSKMLMILLLPLILTANPSWGAETDWGVIPLDQVTVISFGATDITNNFTDQYNFSIQGGTEASAEVTVTFDVCQKGCGNPELTYGVYNEQGQLISEIQGSGSVTLTAGDYYFQVKGTGMGSGNSVDYSGTMTFNTSLAGPANVSGAPEPSDWLLMVSGSTFLAWAVKRRRNLQSKTALRPGPALLSS